MTEWRWLIIVIIIDLNRMSPIIYGDTKYVDAFLKQSKPATDKEYKILKIDLTSYGTYQQDIIHNCLYLTDRVKELVYSAFTKHLKDREDTIYANCK